MAATERHLEDLRRLVFEKQENDMHCDKCGNRIETSWEAGHNRCKECVERELRKRADGANDLRIQNNMMKCCLRWIYEAVDDWYCCNTVREQIKSVYPDIEGDNIESLNQARKPIVEPRS